MDHGHAGKAAVSSRQREAAASLTLRKWEESGPGSNGDAPIPPVINKKWRQRYFRDYVDWLKPYQVKLWMIFGLALAVAALDLLWPLAIKWAIDDVLTPAARTGAVERWPLRIFGQQYMVEPLLSISLAVLMMLVVKQILDTIRGYELAVVNAKMVFQLRRRLFERLLGLSLGEISDMKAGGIASRLSGDVDNVNGLVQAALIGPSVAAVRVLLTITIFLALSWRLAFSALVLLPPLVPLTYIWLKRVRPIYRSAQADKAVVDGRVVETFGGIRVVRSFRREPREEHAYAVGNHTIIRKLLRAAKLELLLEAGWGLLVPASTLLIIWYGGWLVLHGQAKVGDLFAFQIYSVLLLAPIFQIILAFSQTQKGLASMERVFDALRMKPDKPDAPDAENAPAVVQEMRLEGVWFEYRPGLPVLKDISLAVPGGFTVALVGASGAGKSTLTDLMARFHDPARGRIFLNGIDLRKLRLASFRSMLAVVPQDVFLFDGSIAQNIAYGKRGASKAEIIDAAKRANAHEFIDIMPEGYDTLIGERGFKLSGGQKQRLSIARAILADPQILILDEATSNLDTESEQLIQASLSDLLRGRTTFIIAHRLSTITHADLIVVLDEGRVVETGTHEVLMASRGCYAEMVERQRQSFSGLDVVLP